MRKQGRNRVGYAIGWFLGRLVIVVLGTGVFVHALLRTLFR